MDKKIFLLVTLCFTFLVLNVQAASFSSKSKGTTSAQFLKLAPGARAIAMGEAYSALSNDSLSVYWNPAGLNNLQNTHSLSFMHALYVENINYGFLSYGAKLPHDLGFAGASLNYLNIGSIDQTDDAGVSLGAYSPKDLAFSLAYARELFSIPVGATFKYISSKITSSASTFALDLGVYSPWKFFNDKLSLSVSARNIGPGLKFQTEKDPLPFELRFGSLFNLKDNLLLTGDISFPIDNQPILALGTEYQRPFKSMTLAFRGGLNTRTLGDLSGFSGVSFGFGALYNSIALDYALAPLGKLGLTHRVSLGYSF